MCVLLCHTAVATVTHSLYAVFGGTTIWIYAYLSELYVNFRLVWFMAAKIVFFFFLFILSQKTDKNTSLKFQSKK